MPLCKYGAAIKLNPIAPGTPLAEQFRHLEKKYTKQLERLSK